MVTKRSLSLILLISSGLMNGLPSYSEVETTTIKTTTYNDGALPNSTTTETRTVNSGKTITLPAGATYVVIDPLTGEQRGVFDPMRQAVDAKVILPGSVVIDRSTGRILATISESGQTVDVVSVPAASTFITAIDARRAQVDTMITDSLRDGSINTTQATALRSALDNIATRENLAKQSTGYVPYSEALCLALELNNLSDRVVLIGSRKSIVAPIIGSKIVNTNGQLIMVDAIAYRRIALGQRVEDEYTAGRLSARQVSNLNEELSSIASLDSKYRKNGELSASHADRLTTRLNTVQTRLDRDVAEINNKRAKIGIRVQ